MKTKIIATIGPSSMSREVISSLIREGVSGFRINFSHGEEETWKSMVDTVNEESDRAGIPVALIGDLRGPQIRVGKLKSPIRVKQGQIVPFVKTSEWREDEPAVPLPSDEFYRVVSQGDIVLIGDGDVQFRVIESKVNEAYAVALYDGLVSSGKKIIIKGKDIGLPIINEYDIKCIEFALSHEFSHIAVSYVRNKRDVEIVRETIRRRGGDLAIISKIEVADAIRNLDEIITASDAVLVARGDLGLHLELSEIPWIQRNIIEKALLSRKPVMVATEILESMTNQPVPARSDIAGLYTIIEELVDAIVLTNETAIGKYPVETVKWAKKIIERAESTIQKTTIKKHRDSIVDRDLREKYARGLVNLAESVNGKVLIFTRYNSIPPLISSLRPQVPVFVGSSNKRIAMRNAIYYGLHPVFLKVSNHDKLDYSDGLALLENTLREQRIIRIGDVVVEGYGKPSLRLHEVIVREIYD